MQIAKQREEFAPNFGSARLSRANLENANLSEAKAQFVDFREANLTRASLLDALLQHADLRDANLQDADLTGAQLQSARMQGANLCGANLRDAKGLTQDQVDAAFGDAATHLPEAMRAPTHWPTAKLTALEARIEWRKWRSDPGAYSLPAA